MVPLEVGRAIPRVWFSSRVLGSLILLHHGCFCTVGENEPNVKHTCEKKIIFSSVFFHSSCRLVCGVTPRHFPLPLSPQLESARRITALHPPRCSLQMHKKRNRESRGRPVVFTAPSTTTIFFFVEERADPSNGARLRCRV